MVLSLLLSLLVACAPEDSGKAPVDTYHPDGWSDPTQHGMAAKYQDQVCTSCHAEDLTGDGAALSCDTCHAADWRTDCTFCHGGTDNTTGAPPIDIDGLDTDLSFPEHTAHVSALDHAAWTCDQCHATPTDILSPGHLFVDDLTPGEAEVSFTDGLSPVATYAGNGSCSNLYCHGDGSGTNGSVTSGAALDCGSCHGSAADPGTLSGIHAQHLDAGAACGECHEATATGSDTISGPAEHVDGEVDVALVSGMSQDGDTCSGTCHGVEHDGSSWSGGTYHPAGWDDSDVHGLAAKLQTDDCTSCHGADLSGGSSGQGCDTCHDADWRTNCTFCHGGTDNETGAPPRDIDPDSAVSFPEHTAHVEAGDHAAWGCAQCHTTPTDVLSEGHLFVGDTTPGAAELAFVDSLSPDATFSAGTCSNLYCHSDGQGALGTVTTGEVLDCAGCHGSADAPDTLSGVHAAHVAQGATCGECHEATADGDDTIIGPDEHVDGEVDVALTSGMSQDGDTCSGTCHGVEHDASTWADGGFHPSGWDEGDVHGLAAKLQTDDCTTCHGADLSGGTSGASCDSCHASDWRTDCTFCHGGDENSTGAPPVDIDPTSTVSFPEHSKHVEEGIHAAWGCEQCHATPTDILSAGHVFVGDTTPGAAELAFTAGLSAAATFSGGTCSNLYCHSDGKGTLGSISTGDTTSCASCHGDAGAIGTLSAVHAAHVAEGAVCGDCHAATVESKYTIVDPAQHVDGEVDVAFTTTMSFDGTTCSGACHGVDHDGATWAEGGFHPAGWEDATTHGPVANLQEQDCTSCHGATLDGGAGPSCDTCHASDWRTDCTYCHGGEENSTGAPPVDMDGTSVDVSFPAHSAHVEAQNHAAWDCETCHVTPADVLSEGHVYVGDTTPGAAEVDLSAGLSPDGTFSAGTCSNLYCHGDGKGTLGSIDVDATVDCASCHGSATAPGTLSEVHADHLSEGATCGDCHGDTATGDDTISGPYLHVDGDVDLALVAGITRSGDTCTGTCHGVPHDGSTWSADGFHRIGWKEADQHGLAAKLLEDDCTTCHGSDLTGGTSGESCDSCHAADWRTDCTYCHGGTDNETGAPPVDIDGSTTTNFPEHSTHVEAGDHIAWGCETCHTTPADVLSAGHVFVGDDTPGAAEVSFVGGLSPDATFSGAGCSNLYCHSDGQGTLGSVSIGETLDCAGCHGSATAPGTLSAIHAAHLAEGAECGDCHEATATGNDTISGPTEHVDGGVDVDLVAGITWDGATCTGTCHGTTHTGASWTEGGFHPAGWEDPEEHGLSAKLQEQDCTTCHGADLTGGTSGESCDTCHAADWRTDCTYCHGGTDNTTGAPPVDIDGSSTGLSFNEHTVHVEEGIHAAWGCEQCHTTPTDVLSEGHLFVGDTTPAVAELSFTGGLSAAGVYAGAGSCSNLYCHGNGDGTLGSATTGSTATCSTCHASKTSTGAFKGKHRKHLGSDVGAGCQDCHAATVSDSSTISDPTMHVNGSLDVSVSSGMVWNGTYCYGTCHTVNHRSDKIW